jgi:hypothetical protein
MRSAAGRAVTIERLDTRSHGWRTLRLVALTSYGEYAEAIIPVTVQRGTTLRAVLPASQAKPCYLAGYSKVVRT